MTRYLFSSLAVVLAAGVATAQQPAPAVQPGTPVQPGGAVAAYRAKDILGTKVAIQSNTAVGTVDDIVFSAGGDVEYLIVATQDGKLTTVPWAAATFNPAQKTAVVDIPVERWRTFPTYTAQSYPQFFTPTYRTEVYRHYGLTPAEFRRLDRKIDRRNP
ncbi:MAG TPA: PRC-barrel domain-containing protein [Urbifossiella sp.]|nr:PRC-barrel domain-containing protein [Urbifossiella sp.]